MRGTCRRSGWLAVLVAAAAVGLAACAGSSSARVASLGKSGSGRQNSTHTPTSTTTLPKGNPTHLLNEWAACMRSHGDPNQVDPVIVSGNGIRVTQPAGYYGTIYGASGNSDSGPGVTCQAYLTAASNTLRAGQPFPQPDMARQLKYSECMRATGVSSFPDPGGGPGPPSGSNSGLPAPGSPAFQNAVKVCDQRTGDDMPTMNGTVTVPGEIEFVNDGHVTQIFF